MSNAYAWVDTLADKDEYQAENEYQAELLRDLIPFRGYMN